MNRSYFASANSNPIFYVRFTGGHSQQQERRGPDVNMELEVSLEELYLGKTMQVLFRCFE